MNYKEIYNQLINTRKVLNRKSGDGNYYEKHHIIPVSCGGSDDEDNIVLLTFKEHYISHLLLIHVYSGPLKRSMYYALWRMSSKSTNHKQRILSASQYETCRKAGLIAKLGHPVKISTRNKISAAHKGKKLSIETKKILSLKNTGKLRGGMPDEIKFKISRANTGKERTSEANEKNRLRNLGKKQSLETRAKRSEKLIGKSRPKDVVEKISKNNTQRKKVICSNGIIYEGVHVAAKSLNLSQSNITAICYGRRKSTKGYWFKFKT